jgi:hypothetical protein
MIIRVIILVFLLIYHLPFMLNMYNLIFNQVKLISSNIIYIYIFEIYIKNYPKLYKTLYKDYLFLYINNIYINNIFQEFCIIYI